MYAHVCVTRGRGLHSEWGKGCALTCFQFVSWLRKSGCPRSRNTAMFPNCHHCLSQVLGVKCSLPQGSRGPESRLRPPPWRLILSSFWTRRPRPALCRPPEPLPTAASFPPPVSPERCPDGPWALGIPTPPPWFSQPLVCSSPTRTEPLPGSVFISCPAPQHLVFLFRACARGAHVHLFICSLIPERQAQGDSV